MKIMDHIDVKNVIRLIIVLNGLIWFRYVYGRNHRIGVVESFQEMKVTCD